VHSTRRRRRAVAGAGSRILVLLGGPTLKWEAVIPDSENREANFSLWSSHPFNSPVAPCVRLNSSSRQPP
jgi:hypothetical protein